MPVGSGGELGRFHKPCVLVGEEDGAGPGFSVRKAGGVLAFGAREVCSGN